MTFQPLQLSPLGLGRESKVGLIHYWFFTSKAIRVGGKLTFRTTPLSQAEKVAEIERVCRAAKPRFTALTAILTDTQNVQHGKALTAAGFTRAAQGTNLRTDNLLLLYTKTL